MQAALETKRKHRQARLLSNKLKENKNELYQPQNLNITPCPRQGHHFDNRFLARR